MSNMISFKIIITLFMGILSNACNSDEAVNNETEDPITELNLTKTIPAGANSWVANNFAQDGSVVSESGIHNWTQTSDIIRTYFYLPNSGELHLGLKAKSEGGTSKIKITLGSESKEVTLENSEYKTVEVGVFNSDSGYNYIEIQGIEKSGTYIGDITDILIGGPAANGNVTFVPTSNWYFGRRGPSVNIGYNTPSGKDVHYFYNEVTVPEGEDINGSFFMVNGHSEGYFGIQVNGESERRVLFSIWSPFSTDDPNQVPEDYQVTSLGSGEGVTVQNFGNEGTGMQSFKDIGWQTGTTYKFLTKVEPYDDNSTDYTGWYFDPAVGDWQLVASLRRPKTSKYLTGAHSFLENFNPSTGYITRQGEYSNQWVYTTDGQWTEVTGSRFGVDATARDGHRLDYSGSATGSKFVLKNCGFFDENVVAGSSLTRNAVGGSNPDVDFESLPKVLPPAEVTLLDRNGWTIVDFSTQEDNGGEGDTGRAADVLDGNLETYWHSCWSECAATPPHHVTIDMGQENEVDGVRFVQRQTLSRAVKSIEIEISSDNSNWTSMGSFELGNSASNQDLDFASPQTFRYLKFISTASHDETDNAAMAEIMPYKKE